MKYKTVYKEAGHPIRLIDWEATEQARYESLSPREKAKRDLDEALARYQSIVADEEASIARATEHREKYEGMIDYEP